MIATQFKDHQIVAVGKELFWSKTWKTVPDFLSDYLKRLLEPAWGNAELQKPFLERHPIIQWYDAYCRYQAKVIVNPGEVTSSETNGVVICYLGLAYSLYLLAHNVELQDRLLRRLKDKGNFQGAYYELIVASTLIRAGFTLTLEDETDGASKHCEFAAISKTTGKRYWVEAKMRAVAGMLGRTERDGTTSDNPLSSFTKHLSNALAKPATDERLIFIDLNASYDPATGQHPAWQKSASAMLGRYERNHAQARAYVIVTNTPFHRMLTERAPIMALPFGLGMPDFNRPGYYRLSEAYKNKRKHIDGFQICDAFAKYLNFPTTFDGSLPSEAFGRAKERVKIGETYLFEDANNLIGTVTCATVSESEKKIYVSVTEQSTGTCHILSEDMNDDALADYQANREAYFGEVRPVSGRAITDPFEFFEWFMEVYENTPRSKIVEWIGRHFPPDYLDTLSDEDLRAVYCEGLVGHMQRQGMLASPQHPPATTPLTTP
jgi:hypothetical protein